MKNFKQSQILLSFSILVILSGLLTTTFVCAAGFGIFTHGAKDLGMLNSTTAHTLGASSNFHNPALLPEISGDQIEIGTVFLVPSKEFTSSTTGLTTEAEDVYHIPSTLFGVYHLNEKAAIGLGVYFPFGLTTDWPSNWEGRYITTYSDLLTVNFNPNFAYKVSDNFNVSVGIDILYGDAELEQNLNFSPYGLGDGNQNFSGDGFGYGFNLGAYYKINEQFSLGASYRSKVSLTVEGKSNFEFSPGTPQIFQMIFPNTSGEVDLDLPPQFDFGVAYKIRPNLLIELGGKWEGWSSYEELRFDFDLPINGANSINQPKNWEDAWGVNIGVKYDIDPSLAITGGYFHGWSAVPDETLEPAVVDSEKNDIAIGVIKSFDSLEIGLTYALELLEDREKNNTVGISTGGTANGTYSQHIHMVGLSIRYAF